MFGPWQRGAVLAVVIGLAACGGGSSSPSKPPGPKLNRGDACSYLSPQQVQAAFGGPVTVDKTDRGSLTPNDCGFLIGDPTAPSGVLSVTNLFPGFLVPPGQTGVDVVESQRAIDAQAGLTVEDGGVGKQSFIDADRSSITVAATTKFAFELQWIPAGTPAQGGKLDPKVRTKLTALATNVAGRGT